MFGALTFESFGQFLMILATFLSACYFFGNAFAELVIFYSELRGKDRRIAHVLYGIPRCVCLCVCVCVSGWAWVGECGRGRGQGVGVGMGVCEM
jgi:hypothetical protein